MSKKQRNELIKNIVTIVVFAVVYVIDLVINLDSLIDNKDYAWLLPFGIYLVIYLFSAKEIILKAIRNIFRGNLFDENFLMAIATIGAFGIKEFSEGVAVVLFYNLGEWFQEYAVGKSRRSISGLMEIRPDFANLIDNEGNIKVVAPEEVLVNDIILVKPGERIPLDGIVVKGTTTLDTKALTGESLPAEVTVDSNVISGTINLTSTIEVKVLKEFYDSTVSKILDLVENASSKKSKSENFISKFARWYTPIVVLGAVLLVVVGGLATENWLSWLERALNFLVISCPCALVISIPLSFFAGIGGASSNGILIKGSSYLETFDKVNIFVFDKTGTLTKGNFEVTKLHSKTSDEELLKYASIAEANSNHPIANSIRKAYGKDIDTTYELEDVPGKGIIARKNEVILCGNEKLMAAYSIDFVKSEELGTIVYVALNSKFLGYIVISDVIKEEAKDLIDYLNKNNIKSVMLTGDNEAIAKNVANKLGITEYRASLLPQMKIEEVDRLLATKNDDDYLCFVGDGINDAPVLMRSDIGISMGQVGSDAAIEASDIVLMHDDLKAIKIAKIIAKKTMLIVKENIIFALGVKAIVLVLSIFGLANMWLAILADVGVAFVAIINAMRANTKLKK